MSSSSSSGPSIGLQKRDIFSAETLSPFGGYSCSLRTLHLVEIRHAVPIMQPFIVARHHRLGLLRSFVRSLAPLAHVAMRIPSQPRPARFAPAAARARATTQQNKKSHCRNNRPRASEDSHKSSMQSPSHPVKGNRPQHPASRERTAVISTRARFDQSAFVPSAGGPEFCRQVRRVS